MSCNIEALNLSLERGHGKDIWILIALNGTAFLGHILSDCVLDLIWVVHSSLHKWQSSDLPFRDHKAECHYHGHGWVTLSDLHDSHRRNLASNNEKGKQNRPCVVGTLIYERVKLERGGRLYEPVLNMHTPLSPLSPNLFICPTSAQ